MPNLVITIAAGQKPVNALCNRLAPTKAVSQIKYSLTQRVNPRDSNTIKPANAMTLDSKDMLDFDMIVIPYLHLI
jgi:hypothetical protein